MYTLLAYLLPRSYKAQQLQRAWPVHSRQRFQEAFCDKSGTDQTKSWGEWPFLQFQVLCALYRPQVKESGMSAVQCVVSNRCWPVCLDPPCLAGVYIEVLKLTRLTEFGRYCALSSKVPRARGVRGT